MAITKELKQRLDYLYGLSLPDQVDETCKDLLSGGFSCSSRGTSKTRNDVYMRDGCDIVFLHIEPYRNHNMCAPCILDESVYNEIADCRFRSEEKDYRLGGRYHNSPKITISAGRKNKHNLPKNQRGIHRYVLGIIYNCEFDGDHMLKSGFINTKEALRMVTRKENLMNRKCTRGLSEEELERRKKTDFQDTWFVYVYWRMLGLISQEDAFAYNLEKNS